ncbi:hypothetical protein DYB36_009341 [Aphanomyces astaci]|uniref:Uncharacterized protein n=1 Tax=Aphanomyces astaci TaxID=112090 RepID=A0A397BAB3_APHAT|nr:hypothetical protein DYB36_009341 [Aphanomyces astaci]
MNSVVLFCILVALSTTLVASVRAIDVSVLGVPGTFHAPSGVSCGGSDLTRIGACPGPQPRLEFGSCCQALPNRPLLVLGCVPRLAATSGCVVTTLPPTITVGTPVATSQVSTTPERPVSTTPESTSTKTTSTLSSSSTTGVKSVLPTTTAKLQSPEEPQESSQRPRIETFLRRTTVTPQEKSPPHSTPNWTWVAVVGVSVVLAIAVIISGLKRRRQRRVDQCAAAELPPIHPGAQPSPTHAWVEVPNSCRPEGRSSSIGLGQLDQWVDTFFRAVRTPAPNMRLPWVDVPDTASVAVLPLPTPPSEPEPLQATPRPWYKRSVCAVCGIEASCYVTLYREPGATKELRCWTCSSLWV